MVNYHRYLYGYLIGMMVEYIVRVQFSIWPMIIILILSIAIVIDLFDTDFKK
jgi:hypothetical protein